MPERAGPDQLAVRTAVRRDLERLDRGALVLVACSGGPDSVALAAAVAYAAPRLGLRAGAVVVDHGLQPATVEVATRTADWLRGLGLAPVELVAVQVDGAGGPEAAARRARYDALDAVAERCGAGAVLLGHTRDDQAETVLLGLARGSGARSLAGMAPVRGRYRRPLLVLPRATVRAAVPDGAPVWHDPHNDDDAYARVRVRRDALPALQDALGPGVPEALTRSAELLRADADALDGWADRAWEGLATDDGLALQPLAELPAAVRSRVLRRALLTAGAAAGDLTADHVAAVDALVVAWRGQGSPALPGGVGVARRCGRLVVSPGTDPAETTA